MEDRQRGLPQAGNTGQATFTLPFGDYRFRADKNGQQYWSAEANHCTIPGCSGATITTTTSAQMLPLGGGKALAAAFTSPQLTTAPVPQDQSTTFVERTITYTYDPLNRLTAAEYSTGEYYAYQYDPVGNREVMTSTTPLSGTVVTTYTFDAANRLTARAVSDGRAYTYAWSDRGQLLTEWTQGYPVREFTYDAAGLMIRARVFTQTTEFIYNGLGERVAVSVDGYGVTTYTLDYAAGGRILAETTPTETVQYLYGHDCLGEFRDDVPLYYLPDAEGYVRQGVDTAGQITSVWLFDPDGTVLEGPEGPVSHLVCGGVYDWSTGLLYRGGRYFDPAVGIWLVLLPLAVFQAWPGRKRRKGGYPWVVLMCVGWVTLMSVTACIRPTEVPKECIDLIRVQLLSSPAAPQISP